jgi:signal transduction histidine kinase
MPAWLLALAHDSRLQRAGDYALAAVLFLSSLADLLHGGRDGNWAGWRPLELVVTVAISVPLLWRLSRPVIVFWILFVASIASAALVAPHQAGFEPFVALVVAYYSLGAHADDRASARTLVLSFGVAVPGGIAAVATGYGQVGNLAPSLVWTFAAWLMGRIIRSWRARAAQLERLNRELVEQRELQAQAAVAVERGRIARELHDVVAHNVSMIVVQAGAAARVLEGEQPHVSNALQAIEVTGRQTVDEMRNLLGVLRRADDAAALAPQPGLADLEPLAAQVRDAGLPVDLHIEGRPIDLPPGIDLSAYRIVQEALTNTLKHANAAHASVSVRYLTRAVELEVRDDGVGTGNGHGSGHGLIGMRERVALWGGELEAGQTQDGWTVRARLPVPGST